MPQDPPKTRLYLGGEGSEPLDAALKKLKVDWPKPEGCQCGCGSTECQCGGCEIDVQPIFAEDDPLPPGWAPTGTGAQGPIPPGRIIQGTLTP